MESNREATGDEGVAREQVGEAPPTETPGPTKRWPRVPPEVPIFFFYLLVSLFLTWPLIIRFTTSIYGHAGDNLGGVWGLWWVRNASLFGAKPSFCPIIGFPFGTHMGLPTDALSYLFDRFLLLFTNEVIVYNIETLLSFILSGVTMYYLVRYLTKDRRAALFGGFAYLIVPYHAFHAMFIGGGIMAVQWMPLYMLLLIKFVRQPTRKSAALLVLGSVLVAGTSIHYGLFMAVFTFAFLLGRLAHKKIAARLQLEKEGSKEKVPWGINRRTLVYSLAVLLLAAMLIAPIFYFSAAPVSSPGKWPTPAVITHLRTLRAITWGAATPGNYLLPNNSLLLFSMFKPNAVVKELNWKSSIYIGWVIIILAALCFVLWRGEGTKEDRDEIPPTEGGVCVRAEEREKPSWRTDSVRHELCGFLTAAAVVAILSLKPYVYIGSTKIPLPSALLKLFAPPFRWYLRMGIVVGICMIVIACFGFELILERIKNRRWWLLLVPLMALLALEMLIIPPFASYSFKEVPSIFKKVESMPEGSTFAFYPVLESGPFANTELLFYQRWFKKPMLNGAVEESDGEVLRRTVYSPFNPATPGILRRFGIDYLVILERMAEQVYGGKLELSNLPPGLEPVGKYPGKGTFGDSYLFKVTAPKAELVPLYTGEITRPSVAKGSLALRLMGRQCKIKILNYSGRTVRAHLDIPISNPFADNKVEAGTDNSVLWRSELVKGQSGMACIEDLEVPPGGIDISITTASPLSELPDAWVGAYGIEKASIILSDVWLTRL